jgi:Radical SAM superfamily
MVSKNETNSDYSGFEMGPIRPPSEANSLLIRVTRNCPWNRCSFCPAYKVTKFSIRPVDHVIKDIDVVHRYVDAIQKKSGSNGTVTRSDIYSRFKDSSDDPVAFQAAMQWSAVGMQSIFLQDANSLIIKPEHLINILCHLKNRFPWVSRITSYARSHTIARISDENLTAIKEAGLNRIHIGLESGANEVLKMISKGATKEIHIKAGIKVIKAGMELSEYVMPGIGGKAFSNLHAVETADALNQINPHFIRIRTLTVPNYVKLHDDLQAGSFKKCTELETAKEILTFIEHLNGIQSVLKSDHMLNLFQEVEGTLPQDKQYMTDILNSFLNMPPEEQCIYQVGRRLGILSCLADMKHPSLYQNATKACQEIGATPDTVNTVIDDLMNRFV